MKIMRQMLIILLIYILGESVSYLLHLVWPSVFIPGTIIGLFLFFIALMTKLIGMKSVDEVGTYLTGNMSFFFIPVAVSIIDYLGILKDYILQVLLIVTISAIVSFLMIAASVKWAIRMQQRFSKGDDHE